MASKASTYATWTPEHQVKALTKLAHSALVLAIGVGIAWLGIWFISGTVGILIGFVGLLIAIMVAPLIFMTAGMTGEDGKFQRFHDDFCQFVIARAYRQVARVSTVVLFFLFITSPMEQLSISSGVVVGGLLLMNLLVWAWTVLKLVRQDEANEIDFNDA